MDFLAALRPDEVVGDGFIIVQKVVFDAVPLVPQAQDKVFVTEMSIVLHQMPEDRPIPDLNHGFGNIVGVAPQPQSLATAKQYDFHDVSPCPLNGRSLSG